MKQNYKYAPHFLVRIAGMGIDSLTNITFNESLMYLEDLEKFDQEIEELTDCINNELYTYINENKNSKNIKDFINLKRDIFNRRIQKVKKCNPETLSKDMFSNIKSWINLVENYNQKEKEFHSTFNTEILNKRDILKSYFSDSDFINAVQLSNYQLYERLLEYLNFKEEKLPKKLRNAELSLFNYLNRMIFKPTPFSSFTGLDYGFFRNEEESFNINTKDKSHLVKFNLVYVKTIEQMLLNLDKVKANSLVRLNSTIISDNERFLYFKRGKDGTDSAFSNESFLSIKKNALVKEIIDKIGDTSNLTVHQLVGIISKFAKIDDLNKIYNFIYELEGLRLLEFHLGISDQESNYLKEMINKLSHIEDQKVQRCLTSLKKILIVLEKIPTTSHIERKEYFRSIAGNLSEIYKLFNQEINVKELTSLIFEDVHYKGSKIHLNTYNWETYLNDLHLVKKLMPLFDDNVIEKLAQNIIFNELYEGNKNIELLEFYKDYLRYNNNKENKVGLWRKIRNSEDYINIKKLRREFYNYLEKKITDGIEKVSIDPDWLKSFVTKFPAILKDSNNYSFYFQIANDDKKQMLVINKLGPAYGKHFSRYCNLFLSENNSFRESIKKTYDNLEDSRNILVDLNAVLGLNVNSHPILLDNEITYPGCNPNKGVNQIILNDIEVYHDSKFNKLRLISKKSNKQIDLIPLGFLFPMLAPPMYKFLTSFTQTNGIEYSFWNKFLNESEEKYKILPRLTLGSIVLDRKTWRIPVNEINNLFDKESSISFINFNNYVRDNKLPGELFIRVANAMDAFSENEFLESDLNEWIAQIKQTRHRKPQYLDLRNHFHIEALKKIIQDTNDTITVQEVLPHQSDKFYKNVSENAVEFLVECYEKDEGYE